MGTILPYHINNFYRFLGYIFIYNLFICIKTFFIKNRVLTIKLGIGSIGSHVNQKVLVVMLTSIVFVDKYLCSRRPFLNSVCYLLAIFINIAICLTYIIFSLSNVCRFTLLLRTQIVGSLFDTIQPIPLNKM